MTQEEHPVGAYTMKNVMLSARRDVKPQISRLKYEIKRGLYSISI